MQLHGHKVPLYIFKEAILPRAYSSDTLSSSKKKLSKWLGLFKLSRFNWSVLEINWCTPSNVTLTSLVPSWRTKLLIITLWKTLVVNSVGPFTTGKTCNLFSRLT